MGNLMLGVIGWVLVLSVISAIAVIGALGLSIFLLTLAVAGVVWGVKWLLDW